jgi:hypothetical protein
MKLKSVVMAAGLCFTSLLMAAAHGAELLLLPEYLRPTPFGDVVAADRPAGGTASLFYSARQHLSLTAGRGGYISFQLVVKLPEPGEYTLAAEPDDRKSTIQIDLFREWFHFTDSDTTYYPDALVPVTMPYRHSLPDPDNRIEKQTAQGYWVDVWIPPDADTVVHRCRATLLAGGRRQTLLIDLKVLSAQVPENDPILIDHNSYGSSWLAQHYKGVRVPSDESLRLIHRYHRIFYEHRGVYHQLGYGHGGKVIPEFAPELAGTGPGRRVADWELYDRHYAPLLDGSAFAGMRRPAKPIPFVYLPVNPEWPASFLWWGEPGYEAEFVSVLSEMEKHFREKGWTRTRFELFFNHKKRYKAFPWDGDETRFAEDDRYFIEYGRLLEKSIPANSPVKIVFRNDTSWSMERQFRTLAGVINFWVCGNSLLSWYPEAVSALKSRGDIVWMYGGAPPVTQPSTKITESALRTWLYGVDGWVHWQTVDPGSDPWYHFGGGAGALVYPGARFGIDAPIPSVRLKLQRNCVQDLALLEDFRSRFPIDQLRKEVTRLYDGSSPGDWWTPRPKLADVPPHEWSNSSLDEATNERRPYERKVDSPAWHRVRQYILGLAAEGK